MAQKWHEKATVQGALVAGLFVVAAAVITGIFSLVRCPRAEQPKTAPATEAAFMTGTKDLLSALPAAGVQVKPSPHFNPLTLVGLKLDKNDPFHIDFILQRGDSTLDGQALADEALKLIKYFLTALTLPEDHLWVNLSPYEEQSIIPNVFASTRMGKDFLAQDYLLKQLTASFLHPDTELGGTYWTTIYQEARAAFGTDNLPINTYNKVWIIPDQATVVLVNNTALVTSSRLAVLTDNDYLASRARQGSDTGSELPGDMASRLSQMSSEVVKAVLIPELEREVNYGENFGPVRQAYTALVLATWYKQKVRDSLLNQALTDRVELAGLTEPHSNFVDKLYAKYIEAFEHGVFDVIREDYNESTQELIPRKYFSGGITAKGLGTRVAERGIKRALALPLQTAAILVHAALFPGGYTLAPFPGPSVTETRTTVVETYSEDPGGIDFGRKFTIDQIGDDVFRFDPKAFERVHDPGELSPQVLRLIAFPSLGAVIKTEEH